MSRMSLLEVDATRGRLRRRARPARRARSRADARRDRRGDRAERRRQVDAAEGGLRPRHAHGGAVRFDGEDVTGVRADRLTRRGLNFVPQTENVFPTLTVAENVHVSALVSRRASGSAAVARVRELFPILARATAPARGHALGRPAQARRARARARHAPTAAAPRRAVGRALAASRWTRLRQARRDQRALGIGIVMVEQNARRALALAHRGYVLDTGRNAYERTGRAAARRPAGGRALPRRFRSGRARG